MLADHVLELTHAHSLTRHQQLDLASGSPRMRGGAGL
jgi:hypothetical protein